MALPPFLPGGGGPPHPHPVRYAYTHIPCGMHPHYFGQNLQPACRLAPPFLQPVTCHGGDSSEPLREAESEELAGVKTRPSQLSMF